MKPTIYRITHLWPNKQPGHGSRTAQIEEDQERWLLYVEKGNRPYWRVAWGDGPGLGAKGYETVEVVRVADRSSTVQIKPETYRRQHSVNFDEPPDELNALPSRFVSLQDYERLERAGHRVLILDDAEPGEVSEAHVAVIGELRAALSSEATKGET